MEEEEKDMASPTSSDRAGGPSDLSRSASQPFGQPSLTHEFLIGLAKKIKHERFYDGNLPDILHQASERISELEDEVADMKWRLQDRLAELSAKATPGAWSWEDDPPTVYAGRGLAGWIEGMPVYHHGMNLFGRLDLDWNGRNNLKFMVAAVNFVRLMLDDPRVSDECPKGEDRESGLSGEATPARPDEGEADGGIRP